MRTPARRDRIHRGTEAGFTLVELMVVIVIIGLLATVVAINVLPSQEKAMVQKARADIAVLEQAVESFQLDNFRPPATGEGLQSLLSRPQGMTNAERYRDGGYIRRLPKDPWGGDYQYQAPGEHGPYDIYSFGADGKKGGEGKDADLGNWS